MQMAFHRLNGNTEGIEYADAFSMRIFDYYNEILHDFEDPAFNSTRWTFNESPYNQPRVPEEYKITRDCFKKSLFGSSLVDRWKMQVLAPCDMMMFDEVTF